MFDRIRECVNEVEIINDELTAFVQNGFRKINYDGQPASPTGAYAWLKGVPDAISLLAELALSEVEKLEKKTGVRPNRTYQNDVRKLRLLCEAAQKSIPLNNRKAFYSELASGKSALDVCIQNAFGVLSDLKAHATSLVGKDAELADIPDDLDLFFEKIFDELPNPAF